ncbi:MAG TPA: TIGR03943 family protein [Herpetosiphonaceae bacterium]|nr:TIGR03943 family protein [Herpetosiphonaceae bacterium]
MAALTSNRKTHWPALVEAYLLTGIAAMLLSKILYRQLPLYIHPRYAPLVLATAVVMLLIGAVKIWQVGDEPRAMGGRSGLYVLLLAPLLLGSVIPAKPAGSSLIDPKQLNNMGRGYLGKRTPITADTRQWTLFDWTVARFSLSAAETNQQPVDVVGFVYRAPDQPAGQFELARYTLACCVADRSAVSLPVRWNGAASLANDQWVHVTGTIEARDGDGAALLAITNAQVEPVAQPSEPYLYP